MRLMSTVNVKGEKELIMVCLDNNFLRVGCFSQVHTQSRFDTLAEIPLVNG